MEFAVISDVHSNLEALEAVLADIRKRKIKEILFLGDVVGYGPNPNECIETLAETCKILLAGNHDWGTLGLTPIHFFNEHARAALEWTRNVIKEKDKKILESFPIKKVEDGLFLVHSTPKEPDAWHYLLTMWDAEVNFHYFEHKFCFLGHSHQPIIIERVPSGELLTYRTEAGIRKGSRYIINAGSVGQPRDGDPRACFVVMKDNKIQILRVPYDIEKVQRKMRRELLPALLAERLTVGR
ncbi:MAG: metallophosphoesterase family protein [Nitrospirota bacterium]